MLATRVVEACSASSSSRSTDCTSPAASRRRTFPLLVALHAGCAGVLVRAWRVSRVNAPFIFGAKRGTELTATGAVLAGSQLEICAGRVVAMVLVASAATSESRSGRRVARVRLRARERRRRARWCFSSPGRESRFAASSDRRRAPFGARFGAPLAHPRTRRASFFLGALRRGVAAPFHRVIMIDFFLMDQIVSQTAALRDAATVALRAVVPSMARHAPLVALLPGWLRLAQCLRRRRGAAATRPPHQRREISRGARRDVVRPHRVVRRDRRSRSGRRRHRRTRRARPFGVETLYNATTYAATRPSTVYFGISSWTGPSSPSSRDDRRIARPSPATGPSSDRSATTAWWRFDAG